MPLAFISSFPMGMPLREGYEAVTGYPAGHRLASFYPLTWCHENLYLCVDTLKAKECHYNLILIQFI